MQRSSSSDDGSSLTGTAIGALAQADCSHAKRCTPSDLAADFGDEATCVTSDESTVTQWRTLPGLTITDAELEACAAKLATLDCSASLLDPPECQFTGSLTAGAACGDDMQCASGYCDMSSTGDAADADPTPCGKCRDLGGVGDDCALDCKRGLVCDLSTRTCVPELAKGAACTPDGIGCAGDATCTDGVCSDPLAEGAACDAQPGACARNLRCIDGKCTDESSNFSAAGVGQGCDPDPTGKSIVCKASSCVGPDGQKKCVAFASEGEPCLDPEGVPAPVTAPDCEPLLTCENGKCVKTDPASCR